MQARFTPGMAVVSKYINLKVSLAAGLYLIAGERRLF
jgi:hypothetical protein